MRLKCELMISKVVGITPPIYARFCLTNASAQSIPACIRACENDIYNLLEFVVQHHNNYNSNYKYMTALEA